MMRVLQVRHGGGIFVTSLDAPLLLEATGFAMPPFCPDWSPRATTKSCCANF